MTAMENGEKLSKSATTLLVGVALEIVSIYGFESKEAYDYTLSYFVDRRWQTFRDLDKYEDLLNFY